jgi:predicted anti-sigma-YlaC factor YlaD
MRHVPEDELHAYLDQALSRSQCVEIETHLSECAHCRRGRDGIAALRDRTTALLATLTPRALIVPPPFQALIERRSRDVLRSVWERRVRRAGLWAAAIAAAVGAGCGSNAARGRLVRGHSDSRLPAGRYRAPPEGHPDPDPGA